MHRERLTRRFGRARTAAVALAAVSSLAALAACGGSTTGSTTASSTTGAAATSTADPKVTISFLSYNYGTPDIGGRAPRP